MIRCKLLFLTLISTCTATCLHGQDEPKAKTQSNEPMLAMRASGMPQLLAEWPQSRLGQLAAHPEVVDAAKAVISWHRKDLVRRAAVFAAAIELEIEIEPWQLANMLAQPTLWRLFDHPLDQLRSGQIVALLPEGDAMMPRTITTMSCLPKYDGHWTRAFQQEAKLLAKAPWLEARPDAKIGGFPAFVFTAPENEQPPRFLNPGPIGFWMQHLPGTFYYGSARADEHRAPPPPTAVDTPELAMTIDLRQYVEMISRVGGAVQQEFATLGFDQLKQFAWRARFDRGLVLDEWSLELTGEADGFIGAALNGQAALPTQAMPKGAITQVRAAIDLELLLTTLRKVAGDDLELPADVQKDLVAGLTGGFALGVTAPAAGGLIPRIYLALGIKDQPAIERAIAAAMAPMSTRQVTYDDVPCTLLKFDNVPQGIQPAFCIVNDTLHVAESGRSLRALLKAQGAEQAMDVGDAPVPAGEGEILTTFDLRLDEVELYRAFRDIWLPLYALTGEPSPLARDDMPSVEVIAEHCGTSRGVLRRQGDRYTIQHLGVFGGPELAALAMTYGPMISGQVSDSAIDNLAIQIAKRRLEAVWPALEAFEKQQGRRPKDLAELVAAANLPPDALLIPGDDMAEPIELANGQTIRSSFRYFAQPIRVDAINADGEMLLVEIRPHRWNRTMLTTAGGTPEVYGGDSTKPIDQLGK